jgi:hypothetical protein
VNATSYTQTSLQLPLLACTLHPFYTMFSLKTLTTVATLLAVGVAGNVCDEQCMLPPVISPAMQLLTSLKEQARIETFNENGGGPEKFDSIMNDAATTCENGFAGVVSINHSHLGDIAIYMLMHSRNTNTKANSCAYIHKPYVYHAIQRTNSRICIRMHTFT